VWSGCSPSSSRATLSGPEDDHAHQLVLRALLADPTAELYGVQIGDAAGLVSGTVHPILARLEGINRVESRWEDVDPAQAGRPARR
jgi:PadR family transcriptional regulator